MTHFPKFLIAVLALGMITTTSAFADIAGSSDHPLVGRYQGSEITAYQVKDYEETIMPREPITRATQDSPEVNSVSVSGKLTAIGYEGPENRSALEVLRNFQQALEATGFATVFSCRKDECGYNAGFWEAARGEIGLLTNWDTNTYALLKLERPVEGNVWVSVFAIEYGGGSSNPLKTQIAVRVIEEQPLETGRIELVRADEMAASMGADGRIILYGIEFDHDSDVVKESSAPQINEVAAYLNNNPGANILVVGHTDITGSFDYNRALSERRAAAVVAKLTGEHNIAASRLFAAGVGPASPVATNRTDDGRARNRRVEIVDLPAVN